MDVDSAAPQRSLSIADELRARQDARPKRYTHFLDNDGFEIGYGNAGHYAGHAHLHLCDVVYSPTGVRCQRIDGAVVTGSLLIVPPRTYFGPIETDKFFFMKFTPVSGEVRVPDKVDERLIEGRIEVHNPPFTAEWPWYHPKSHLLGMIRFVLGPDSLRIVLNTQPFAVIVA